MLGVIGRVGFGVWLGCFTAAGAQLPPDVMVDKYLLQAKMLSEEKDHKGALEAMDRIVALQKEHGLTLPEAFPFHYAQTALAAGAVQAAIDSVNRYLSAAGREGKHYREALELLVKAERKLQEPDPDPVGSTPVKPDLELQPEPVPPSSAQAQKTTAAQPLVDCKKWNTEEYFRKASVESVTACLSAGADPMARDEDKHTPLHLAAQSNENPAIIQVLLAAGADVNARDKDQWTPVLGSAMNENLEVIKVLLKAGGDVQVQGDGKITPLHFAAGFNKNPEMIEFLLRSGVDPQKKPESKWTPLHFAAKFNENVAVIKALLVAGGDLKKQLKKRTDEGYMPLHLAAQSNENPAVIEALLAAGANPMARDKTWWKSTPLHLAAWLNENPAVAQLLINAGADVNKKSTYGVRPLHLV